MGDDANRTALASNRRTAIWIVVTGLGQGWRFILSVLTAVVLGRLLLPRDFGLVATVAPIVGFVDLLRDLGFSQAIVQRADVGVRQGHALFWSTMAVTGALGLAMASASPLFAAVFHEPRLIGLLIASACSMQIASFSSQPWAWMNRQLRFREIAIIDGVQGTIGLVVSGTVAFFTHSYWSIYLGGLATTTTGAVLATMWSGWRPGRPTFDRQVWEMAKFGAGVSTSNIMNFFARNSDNLLIARYAGAVQLGLYDRAYKLMLLPLSQITWPISRVLTPVLSRLQDSPAEYRRTYLSTTTYLMAAAQPGLLVAVVFASSCIRILLGARWAGSAEIFAWLGFAAVHQVVTSTLGWLYLSQGRARQYAVASAFNSLTTVASFLVGLHWGALGVAAAYVVSDYAIRLPFSWWYAGREGPVRIGSLVAGALPHGIACLATFAALWMIKSVTPSLNLAQLAGYVAGAYVVYGVVICAFKAKRTLAAEALNALRSRLRRTPITAS